MPLLTTMTLMALTRDEAPERHPFTDPEELISRLRQLPDGETRSRALEIAGEMQQLLSEYRLHLDSALELYTQDSAREFVGADEFQARLQPIDKEGLEVVLGFIKQREALLELFPPELWNRVFR